MILPSIGQVGQNGALILCGALWRIRFAWVGEQEGTDLILGRLVHPSQREAGYCSLGAFPDINRDEQLVRFVLIMIVETRHYVRLEEPPRLVELRDGFNIARQQIPAENAPHVRELPRPDLQDRVEITLRDVAVAAERNAHQVAPWTELYRVRDIEFLAVRGNLPLPRHRVRKITRPLKVVFQAALALSQREVVGLDRARLIRLVGVDVGLDHAAHW